MKLMMKQRKKEKRKEKRKKKRKKKKERKKKEEPGSHLSPTAGFKAELVVHREEPFLALNLSCKYTEKKKKKKKKKEEK